MTTQTLNASKPRSPLPALAMLRLENRAPVAHRFDIDELNIHESMFHGEQGMAMFTPNTPGVYEFYCDLPGHREHMRGKLIVEAP